MFTASDLGAAYGPDNQLREGIKTILMQVDPVTWETAAQLQGWGIVAQAESEAQYEVALHILGPRTIADRAIVTTLGIDPAPAINLGITTCFVECYLQGQSNALDKYGQAVRDGWPDVWPIIGAYDGIGLDKYVEWLRSSGFLKTGRWGIYLAEGMGDTGSWPTLAALAS